MENGQKSAGWGSSPYGVLFLPALINGTAQQQDIMLPLTLTYLLSMHLRFYLPVAGTSVGMVESIFDQVLSGHSLESKGVVYTSSVEPEQLRRLLEKAGLVITTDAGSRSDAPFSKSPQAVVSYVDGKVRLVRLRNADSLADQELKAKLVGCTQLINIQAGGFITEGHFSLSW